jgi:VWFA-related protein
LASRRFARRGLAALAAAACASFGLTVRAQTPAPSPAASPTVPTFGAATELVYVRFHVEKKGGKKAGYVENLTAENVRVFEDGKPVTVALLETPTTRERTVPPEVTLALDVSGSVMDARLLDESMVRNVLLATLGEQSRVGLCAFGGKLECFTPPTRDSRQLMMGFQTAMRFGYETRRQGTRLYSSLVDIARKPQTGEKAQRAFIVFTDGIDTMDGSVKEAIQAAQEADVRVYAIKLAEAFNQASGGGGLGGGTPNRTMYDYKKLDLDRLADETGGQAFEPVSVDPATLARILREIATEISMENVVGYQPDGPPTGKKRKVKVELADKSLGKIPDGERTLVR